MEPLLMIWKNGATHKVTTEQQKASFEKAGWKPYTEPEPVEYTLEKAEPETAQTEQPEPEPEKPKEGKKNARKNSELSE